MINKKQRFLRSFYKTTLNYFMKISTFDVQTVKTFEKPIGVQKKYGTKKMKMWFPSFSRTTFLDDICVRCFRNSCLDFKRTTTAHLCLLSSRSSGKSWAWLFPSSQNLAFLLRFDVTGGLCGKLKVSDGRLVQKLFHIRKFRFTMYCYRE